MIIKVEDLTKEELVEALNKAMKQISKLVDEKQVLEEELKDVSYLQNNQYIGYSNNQ